MLMTIDVPEKIVRDAEINGVSVEAHLRTLSDQAQSGGWESLSPLNPGPRDPEAAAVRIEEFASRHTLGGLKITDLRDEGRKR